MTVLNPIFRHISRALFGKTNRAFNVVPVATLKYYGPPVEEHIDWPEVNKLKFMEKQPVLLPLHQRKPMKRLYLMRGPELVHNSLIHHQYGIQAMTGGRLKYEHFEFIRRSMLKKFDYKNVFALWRVDAPWFPVTKKSANKKHGGGKGPIHHYVTPVRAGRIILEFGGNVHIKEMEKKVANLASNLPFRARFVTHALLEKEKVDKKWREENNLNQYTMEYVIKNNLGGCNNWLSPYDYRWFGEYR